MTGRGWGGRATVRTIGAAAATLSMLVTLVPAPAGAVAAGGPVTVVTLDSQEGEYFGQGAAHTFIAPDTVQAAGSSAVVRVYVADGIESHRIELAAPVGGTLEVGPYENAWRSTDAASPGLDVTLGSSACSRAGVVGRFDVLEAPSLDGGIVTAFAADFEFRCDPSVALYGSIRINSSIAIKALDLSSAPSDTITFPTTDVMVASAPMTVTVTNVGNADVTLAGPSLSGAWPGSYVAASSCPVILATGAGCDVELTFRPETNGQNAAILTLTSEAWRWGRTVHLSGGGTFPPATNTTAATAITIGSLPFGHGASVVGVASTGGWIVCEGNEGSLWYRYATPVKRRIELDPTGSGGPFVLMVMAGSSSIAPFACGHSAGLTFTAEANVAYWIRIQSIYSSGSNPALTLQAREAPADTVVEASRFAVTPTTFYPYVDGYVDTTAIKGFRGEKASVSISIYSATGSRVRTLSSPMALGTYSVAWNGKTSSGALVAAGRYRVVQAVTDLWGNKLTSTLYVTVSRKRLYTYTWSRTLDAAAYSSQGRGGTGTISRSASSYGGGLRIASGKNGGAAVGYQFSLPHATTYKRLTFQVLGRGNPVAGAEADTGIQDWTICRNWGTSCVDRWGETPLAYGWAGVTVSGSRHVTAARVARGYVQAWTYGGISKWLDMRDVRLTVVYGVLK